MKRKETVRNCTMVLVGRGLSADDDKEVRRGTIGIKLKLSIRRESEICNAHIVGAAVRISLSTTLRPL